MFKMTNEGGRGSGPNCMRRPSEYRHMSPIGLKVQGDVTVLHAYC